MLFSTTWKLIRPNEVGTVVVPSAGLAFAAAELDNGISRGIGVERE